jgi:hypothetical protein
VITGEAHHSGNEIALATSRSVPVATMAVNGYHSSSLIELTDIISENTKKIDYYFAANHLPKLSFKPDAPLAFPVSNTNKEIQDARRLVVNATQELHDLMVGPRETIRWMSWSVSVTSRYRFE